MIIELKTDQLPQAEVVPQYLPDVLFRDPNIGYFPSLADVKHGFSWGKPLENMAYKWEGTNPDLVTNRINSFLKRLDMSSIDKSYVIEAYADDVTLDITE